MIGDLFDSPWKILIVAVVIIVLFGSAKLPAAARSLGKSMRILKAEVKDMHEDETEPALAAPVPPAVQPAVAQPPSVQPVAAQPPVMQPPVMQPPVMQPATAPPVAEPVRPTR